MRSIRLFGGASIEGESGALMGPATQRHRLALLALLAAAHPRGLTRDKVIATLWPERDAEHGRNLLNQAVHVLRGALGEAAIRSVGDELRLDPGGVECDLIALDLALGGGDPRRVVELYTGPFLDGFFLPDAPGFERWVSAERERLARSCARALEELAEAASARGHRREAVEWWRRVVAHDPYSARTVLRLMEALEAAGDRAAALRQARDHSELLREDLGAEPNPEVEALAGRLQRTARFRPPGEGPPGHGSRGSQAGAPAGAAQETSRSRPAVRGRTVAGLALFLVSLLLVSSFMAEGGGPPPPGAEGLDPRVVAVLPFRVAAADPSLENLHEGMVELLYAKLTSGGSRAVNPRAVMSAVRRMGGDGAAFSPDGARSLGRSLGAGSVLLGEVTSVAARVALSAQLLDVRTGRVAASAAVAGPADSLLGLLDELVIELLARENDEAEYRVGSLTTKSIPAVAAYLRGMASHRRGQYDSAIMSLERAIALDSTFALAALGLVEATLWATSDYPVFRAIRLAWSLRDQLSSRDRILLESLTGAPPHFLLTGDVLEARKRAVLAAPDRPEAWLELGDVFFHWGRFHGIDAPLQKAEAAFRRALELDSAFAAPLLHLIELAVTREDTVEIRTLRDLYLAQASTSDLAGFVRWRTAVALGEHPPRGAASADFQGLGIPTLSRILRAIRVEGVALDQGPAAARALASRARGEGKGIVSWTNVWLPLMSYSLDRGRPLEALSFIERLSPESATLTHIVNALYWDGDLEAAADAAGRLTRAVEDARESAAPQDLWGLCILEQWRVSHGQIRTVRGSIERLRAIDHPPSDVCAAMLNALLAARDDSSDQAAAARELESLLLETGVPWGSSVDEANLILARVHEASGDAEAALAAIRRGGFYPWNRYGATYFREEGRLAALTGDTVGALEAYGRYCALRRDPEPHLVPEIERVRRDLDRLLVTADAAGRLTRAVEDARESAAGQDLSNLCVLEQWRVSHGQTRTVRGSIERLRAIDHPAFHVCAAMLNALHATRDDSSDRAAAARELESLLLETGVPWGSHLDQANLILARVHEASRDGEAALAAVRRGGFYQWNRYGATYFREEGRLAALTGDTVGALEAYRRYCALRSDPEPSLVPEIERVRRDLDRLLVTADVAQASRAAAPGCGSGDA